jgi:hypothetical protein
MITTEAKLKEVNQAVEPVATPAPQPAKPQRYVPKDQFFPSMWYTLEATIIKEANDTALKYLADGPRTTGKKAEEAKAKIGIIKSVLGVMSTIEEHYYKEGAKEDGKEEISQEVVESKPEPSGEPNPEHQPE